MLKQADTVASYGLVVAGIVHTALTPLTQPAGGQGALWFAGTGLALGTLGLLNLARRAAPTTIVCQICAAANLVSVLYLLAVTWMLRAPHVVLVLAMAAIVTGVSLRRPAHELAASR